LHHRLPSRGMITILSTVVSKLGFRLRRRASLELELITLRHQASVLRRQRPRRQLSAVAAKGVTQTIPIVFNAGTNPVTLGLVASLSRPGGNATGIAVLTEQLTVKRLELMQELAPKGSTLGFLVNLAMGLCHPAC
jgi:hypothetical protein